MNLITLEVKRGGLVAVQPSWRSMTSKVSRNCRRRPLAFHVVKDTTVQHAAMKLTTTTTEAEAEAATSV
jgi:hypothetical protein